MKLYIVDSQNVSRSINILDSETVGELKEEIKKKNSIIGDIELVYDGDILKDKDQLCKLEIPEEAIINYLGIYNAGFN